MPDRLRSPLEGRQLLRRETDWVRSSTATRPLRNARPTGADPQLRLPLRASSEANGRTLGRTDRYRAPRLPGGSDLHATASAFHWTMAARRRSSTVRLRFE